MPKITKDFSGQNLQGKDFKGENLENADFTDADIRGANFTGANLKGAKFCKARAGLQPRTSASLAIASLILIISLGFISASSGNYAVERLGAANKTIPLYFVGAIGLMIFALFSIVAVKKGPVAAAGFLITAIVVAVVLAVSFAWVRTATATTVSEVISGGVAQAAAAGAISLIGALLITVVTTAKSRKIAHSIGIIGFAGSFAIVTGTIFLKGLAQGIIAALVMSSAAILSTNLSLAIFAGDEQQKFIKNISIYLATIGFYSLWRGTSFKDADLTDADFQCADLRNTDFQSASLTRTYWLHAKNLQLAHLDNTYLENIQIQNLVISGKGDNKNFDRRDLRGLNLSYANLKNASFIGTNFYEANLYGADLSDANLTQSKFEQANLTQAILTGSCIDGWLVTRTTKLSEIECKFIYLKYEDGRKRDQFPREGDFQEGEFILFISSVLDTIDIYHKDNVDPRAAIVVLKSLSKKYNEPLQIVALERRDNGAIIFKVKTSEFAPKLEIKEEYYDRYEQELVFSMKDPTGLLQSDTNRVEAAQQDIRYQVDMLTKMLIEIKNRPADSPYQVTVNVTDSQVSGGLNIIQGNRNQLTIDRNTVIKELLNQILLRSPDLPADIKEKIINTLDSVDNDFSRN